MEGLRLSWEMLFSPRIKLLRLGEGAEGGPLEGVVGRDLRDIAKKISGSERDQGSPEVFA